MAGGWHDLDAIVVARGPGSFTGLRTACAVAQGLAYGARSEARPDGLPVLPVDTLLALAEEARLRQAERGQPVPKRVAAGLDARMGEMYVALYALRRCRLASNRCSRRACAARRLAGWWRSAWPDATASDGEVLAGNVFEIYGAQFSDLPGRRQPALPTARALLRLAAPGWRRVWRSAPTGLAAVCARQGGANHG